MLLGFLNLSPNLSVFIFVFVRILLVGGNMLAIPWYSIFFYVYLCSFSSSVSPSLNPRCLVFLGLVEVFIMEP